MIPHDQAPEHEFEAAYGLPEKLPESERLLWQGSPDWRVMAREAMHLRGLTVYFGVVLLARAGNVLGNGGSLADAGIAALFLLPLALAALGLLALLAWLVSKTSVYTITDRRVVMRIGVVLSITFNLPFTKIDSAGVRLNRDGSGDVSLQLGAEDNIAYLNLWPHARPWRVKRTEPLLRAIPDAQRVAALLSEAMAHAAGLAPVPVPSAAPERLRPVSHGTGQATPARRPLAA